MVNTANRQDEMQVKDLSAEMGVVTSVEYITPEIAERYLTKNSPTNRKIHPSAIRKYVSDLKSGNWQFNGESIAFSKNGTLLNGQHRLRSIILAGKGTHILVVRGIPDDTIIFDVQARRTSSDRNKVTELDLQPCAQAAVKALVGNFTIVGAGIENKYSIAHADEIRRAYNSCAQGMPGKKSLKASCVLASYLMLRTKTLQFHDLDVFFQIFNSMKTAPAGSEYEASPAIIASKMFDTLEATTVRRTRTQLEILILAMEDFAAKKERKFNYVLTDNEHWRKYADLVRKEDGLEDDI